MKFSFRWEWSGRSVLTNRRCPCIGPPREWSWARFPGVGAGVVGDRDMYLGSPAQRSNPFIYHFWRNTHFDTGRHQNQNDTAIGTSFKIILYIVLFLKWQIFLQLQLVNSYLLCTWNLYLSVLPGLGIYGTQLNRVNFTKSLGVFNWWKFNME